MSDFPTILLALAVVIVVAAFIAQPFFSAQQGADGNPSGRRTSAILRQRADLLAERNRIYAAIRDLDFDYKTNKVSDDDYAAQRFRLVAAGVDVLQRLDSLLDHAEDDRVEAAVQAMRAGGNSDAALPGTEGHAAGYCPQCGEPVQAGDRYCGACGTRL